MNIKDIEIWITLYNSIREIWLWILVYIKVKFLKIQR